MEQEYALPQIDEHKKEEIKQEETASPTLRKKRKVPVITKELLVKNIEYQLQIERNKKKFFSDKKKKISIENGWTEIEKYGQDNVYKKFKQQKQLETVDFKEQQYEVRKVMG